MIGFLVLALQAAAPDVVVDTLTSTQFQTTAETQPMILYYQNCLAPLGAMTKAPKSGTVEERARLRIVSCADIRKWALSTGISAYRPRPGDDPEASHFMETALGQVEQGFLAQARYVDDLISGKIKPPGVDFVKEKN